jgi:thioredoxin 1
MAIVQAITEQQFDATLASHEFVLVDFFATWCPPCQVLLPILDAVAPEFEGKLGFAKLNVDEATKLSTQFNVRTVPTLMLFRNGQLVRRHSGVLQRAELRHWLQQSLAPPSTDVSTQAIRNVRFFG